MEQLQTYVTFIKDLITGCAAAIAAYIAIRGYNTWKEQLKGQAEHDLARRVLIAIYRVKDSIQPILFSAEIEEEIEDEWDNLQITPDELSHMKKSLKEKFEKLHEVETNLSVELLEAEAMWGDEPTFKSRILQFTELVQRLEYYVYGFKALIPENFKFKDRSFDYTLDYRKFSTTLSSRSKWIIRHDTLLA